MKLEQLPQAEATAATKRVHTLGDLFSGGGGFSLGAHLAGFHTAFAVDCDPDLTSSYTTNFPKTKLILERLGEVTPEEILEKANVKPGELSGVIGGPPCQGFSTMGHCDPNDARNSLLGSFFEFVVYADPAFFVMENVPNIMAEKYESILSASIARVSEKYTIVGPLKVDATRFGAATKRIRVVVIGYDPKRVGEITEAHIRALESDTLTTVYQAIHDLPDPEQGSEDSWGWQQYKSAPDPGPKGEYARRARRPPAEALSNDVLAKKAGSQVSGLQHTQHSDAIIERVSHIKPGGIDKTSKAKRLSWEAACTVIRAGTGKERGSHQAVRPIHPEKPRVITVREAARIQGFPDWFQFHETKWHSFRMIGNSVSPYLSQAILTLLKSRLLSV